MQGHREITGPQCMLKLFNALLEELVRGVTHQAAQLIAGKSHDRWQATCQAKVFLSEWP